MKNCSSCMARIIGKIYTATHITHGKSYSYILCIKCAKEAKPYGITINPDIKD